MRGVAGARPGIGTQRGGRRASRGREGQHVKEVIGWRAEASFIVTDGVEGPRRLVHMARPAGILLAGVAPCPYLRKIGALLKEVKPRWDVWRQIVQTKRLSVIPSGP